MFNQYNPLESYQNTSFTETQNNSLRSSFLGFGEIFPIAFDLFKKRIGNLFLPVLIYQLVLFIIFAVIEGGLIFSIFKSIPQGSQIFVANPIDENTQNLSKEFVGQLSSIVSNPTAIFSFLAIIIVFIIFVLVSQWIAFKSMIMINDTASKVIDYNIFKTKFVTLIGLYIIITIITNIISNILSIQGNVAINIILSALGFIFSLVLVYFDVIINYITRLFLYEQNGLFKSSEIIIDLVKKNFGGDLLRQFLMGIIGVAIFVVIFFVIGGFAFASLIPVFIVGSSDQPATNAILPLVISAILFLICIILSIILTWFLECYQYICFYNLRWSGLYDSYHNTNKQSQFENSFETETKTQTLEEKLMESSTVEANISSSNVQDISQFVNSDTQDITMTKSTEFVPFNTPSIIEKESSIIDRNAVLEEFQMMDIDIEETEKAPTTKATVIGDPQKIIGSSAASIINLANIKKTEDKKDDLPEILKVTPLAAINPSKHDNLKIVEGIGPKIEELLNENGINTYSQLASKSVSQLQDILALGGSRFTIHNPSTWPTQAALARDGKIEELETLKANLNGGV
jgi:predicted flap endonuclease-1-like 5' DNA nuclease